MHIFIDDVKKYCIFWSPRCGYKSLHNTLTYNNSNKTLGDLTHIWKEIKYEDIKDYKQVLLYRDPWSRFKSFWRLPWLKKELRKYNIDENISMSDFYIWYKKNKDNYIDNLIHHCIPQNSQANILINWDNIKCYHLSQFDELCEELDLTNNGNDNGLYNLEINNEPPYFIFEMYKDDYELLNKIINKKIYI